MHVLQIHNTYLERGGEDLVVEREKTLLEASGHRVDQVLLSNPDGRLQQARDLTRASWNERSAAVVERQCASTRPDIVHVHNTWYSATPAVVQQAAQVAPVVATLHNYRRNCLNAYLFREGAPCLDCVGRTPWRGVVRRCYRGSVAASAALALATVRDRSSGSMVDSVDRFLVLSDFAAEMAVASGIPGDALVRHDNFVFDPGPRSSPPHLSDTVLAVGRLSPEKGFGALLDMWARLGMPGLRLVVVGDGPERRRLEARADRSVRFTGRLDSAEVLRLMLASRALLFPSRWFEGQPLVLIEAMAAGLSIVSSDHPPLRELLGSVAGLAREDDWASALEAIGDDGWVASAGAASRARYEHGFTPAIARARLLGIYGNVLRRP